MHKVLWKSLKSTISFCVTGQEALGKQTKLRTLGNCLTEALEHGGGDFPAIYGHGLLGQVNGLIQLPDKLPTPTTIRKLWTGYTVYVFSWSLLDLTLCVELRILRHTLSLCFCFVCFCLRFLWPQNAQNNVIFTGRLRPLDAARFLFRILSPSESTFSLSRAKFCSP